MATVPPHSGAPLAREPHDVAPHAVAVVRYGKLRRIAEFTPPADTSLEPQARCVVRTPRGLELGTVLALLEREAPSDAELVRSATPDDLARGAAHDERSREDLLAARQLLTVLDGRLVAAERLLEGERVVLYYTSRGALNVPEQLKLLRQALRADVALVQVGARQRAKVEGGCGPCGRELCCSTFLRRLEPVPMRAAKVQGLDLDPERLAGRCGRLKCCLRYERPQYEEHRQGLPKVGWRVTTRRIAGTVIAQDVLRRKVLVRPDVPGARPRAVFAAEVLTSTPPRALPMAGDAAPGVIAGPGDAERGWSVLARRLWKRVSTPKEQLEPGADAAEPDPDA